MADASLTWLGHASFRLDTPGGKRVYVDPWLSNPKCPDGEKEPERIDVIAITHGHGDHVGETVELSKKFEPKAVIAMVELKAWLKDQGAKVDELPGSNKGGTVDVDGVKFTLVNAFHSSAADDGTYVGEAAGLVLTLEDGRAIYFAGDTCVFSDMQLIGRIYSPELAVQVSHASCSASSASCPATTARSHCFRGLPTSCDSTRTASRCMRSSPGSR